MRLAKWKFIKGVSNIIFLKISGKNVNLFAKLHQDLVKDFSRYKILTLTRNNYSDINKHIIENLVKSRII